MSEMPLTEKVVGLAVGGLSGRMAESPLSTCLQVTSDLVVVIPLMKWGLAEG